MKSVRHGSHAFQYVPYVLILDKISFSACNSLRGHVSTAVEAGLSGVRPQLEDMVFNHRRYVHV